MRKILILVMVASLVTAGAALADRPSLVAQPDATFAFGTAGVAAGPATTNNDDSCDISVAPAATLLLPYFEVETSLAIDRSIARSTLFTITNVSSLNQIAKVTVWTDWSYPVLDFNIWLSPYDVQSINLRDVIVGVPGAAGAPPVPTIAPTSGTSAAAAANVRNTANANHTGTAIANCTGLIGQIPSPIAEAVRGALTVGTAPAGSAFYCRTAAPANTPLQIGGNHGTVAVGYITIDVVNDCTTTLPTSATYYNSEILFDNVLIGDYQDVNITSTRNDAGGNPLVHIRAVPEGGRAGSFPADSTGVAGTGVTNLPYTFYDRYTTGTTANPATGVPDRRIDRRQPLPSTFAARYIAGGSQLFQTDFKIWREGVTGNEGVSPTSGPGCEVAAAATPVGFIAPITAYAFNSRLAVADVVRFDERENATTLVSSNIIVSPAPGTVTNVLPETSRVNVGGASAGPLLPAGSISLPAAPSTDVGGWFYLNLNNGGSNGVLVNTVAYSARNTTVPGAVATGTTSSGARQSQNWVIVSMQAPGTTGAFSVDFDAAWLGNGCTPGAAATTGTTLATRGTGINPAGGVLVCPPGTVSGAGTTAACTGTNATP